MHYEKAESSPYALSSRLRYIGWLLSAHDVFSLWADVNRQPTVSLVYLLEFVKSGAQPDSNQTDTYSISFPRFV